MEIKNSCIIRMISIVMVICLSLSIVGCSNTSDDSSDRDSNDREERTHRTTETTVDLNEGKGVSSIAVAVNLYVQALKNQDASYMDEILDEYLVYDGLNDELRDKYIYIRDNISSPDNMNWDGYEYSEGDTYSETVGDSFTSYTYCDVTITIHPRGWILENSTFDTPYGEIVTFHKINDRWFYGRVSGGTSFDHLFEDNG